MALGSKEKWRGCLLALLQGTPHDRRSSSTLCIMMSLGKATNDPFAAIVGSSRFCQPLQFFFQALDFGIELMLIGVHKAVGEGNGSSSLSAPPRKHAHSKRRSRFAVLVPWCIEDDCVGASRSLWLRLLTHCSCGSLAKGRKYETGKMLQGVWFRCSLRSRRSSLGSDDTTPLA